MGKFVCPKQLTVKIPPYHQAIVEQAMCSGRYGTASEFFRECIKVYGEIRGFAPAEDSSLSPPARQADNTPNSTSDQVCPQGEPCQNKE